MLMKCNAIAPAGMIVEVESNFGILVVHLLETPIWLLIQICASNILPTHFILMQDYLSSAMLQTRSLTALSNAKKWHNTVTTSRS
jgi:hypothetical protein